MSSNNSVLKLAQNDFISDLSECTRQKSNTNVMTLAKDINLKARRRNSYILLNQNFPSLHKKIHFQIGAGNFLEEFDMQ